MLFMGAGLRELAGKTALITGGAGGLGRAKARALGRVGVRLILWDLDEARLDEVVGSLRRDGFEARGMAVDVTEPDAVREAAGKAIADIGAVDILDNNAGVVFKGGLLDGEDAHLRRTMQVNLESYVWCTRAFLPGMLERGTGHIVMTASAAGMLGVPGMAVYSATKHAVIGLAESLRLELRELGASGIGMTILCPSFITTGMFDGVKPPFLTPWLTPERIAERTVSAIRSGRLHVREPFMVRLVPLLKVLPPRLLDLLGDLLGMHASMRGFQGR